MNYHLPLIRHSSNYFASIAIVILLSSCLAAQADKLTTKGNTARPPAPWLDRQLDIDARVRALISKMTLAEKIGQLQQANNVATEPAADKKTDVAPTPLEDRIRAGSIGSILNEVEPVSINRWQKIAVEESRLGVPLIFGRDVIHGFRTIFPIPLGQAASWNPELVESCSAIAAREARSSGIHWTFAPMVDIARDPRWGRIAESLGEDPCLAARLAAAMVRGLQGDDLAAHDRVAACAKHFAGYGAGEGGRDYNTANIAPSLLRNVYLPPFQAAVDANVATLMTSFSDVNGVPSSANTHLLEDVLRKDWGFRGFVVSDWGSIREMIVHGYSQDEKDAAKAAIEAGVNMEMVSATYSDHLAELVHSGKIPESLIDRRVADVLRVKFQLGLFDQPYVDHQAASDLPSEHLQFARRLACQSIVLLKNQNGLLPLDKSKIKRLAVIGPLADSPRAQLGTWAPDARESDSRTLLAALRESAGSELEVIFAPGLAHDLDQNKDKFGEAVDVARRADVVLLAVGERAELSGEARSRSVLDLPGAQNELVDAVAATGKPIVLIVQAGRPLTIGPQVEQVDGALYSFHAGTMAGRALADLLWGIESPSGKLPVTFPKSVGQIPLYYNHPNTGRPPRSYDLARDSKLDDAIELDLGNNSNYIDIGPYPLFPFGYGLSYTTFEYGEIELSSHKIRTGDVLAIRAPVTNTGDRAADEIVQLYIRDRAASIVRPVRELKDFRRVRLEPGETEIVEFALPTASLAYFDVHERPTEALGEIEVCVGGNSLADRAAKFEIVERRANREQ